MRAAALAFALLTLAACSPSSPPPPPAATPAAGGTTSQTAPISAPAAANGMAAYDGYGALRLGMDEATFRKAWQGELAGQLDAAGGCSVLRPVWAKAPGDLRFMFEQGRFVRYDIGTAKEPAPGGGTVGMDGARIRALYGEAVQVAPHKYEAGASTLRIATPDGRGALVFETDASGKVTRWRVGLTPQVDYVEGCG